MLSVHLQEINEVPLLTAEEEIDLAKRMRRGDKNAREHFTRANLRLVVKIARDYLNRGLSLEDLIGEGYVGLLRAVKGFNPKKGCKFSTYGTWWIKQAIKRALVNEPKGRLRIPAAMVDWLNKWRRIEQELCETLGRTPTNDEIAKTLKLSKATTKSVLKAFQAIDLRRSPDEVLETMNCERTPIINAVEDKDGIEEIGRRMGALLSEFEAIVVSLRFGLYDGIPPMTLKAVGEQFDLTRERIRQIERDALNKLRDPP